MASDGPWDYRNQNKKQKVPIRISKRCTFKNLQNFVSVYLYLLRLLYACT